MAFSIPCHTRPSASSHRIPEDLPATYAGTQLPSAIPGSGVALPLAIACCEGANPTYSRFGICVVWLPLPFARLSAGGLLRVWGVPAAVVAGFAPRVRLGFCVSHSNRYAPLTIFRSSVNGVERAACSFRMLIKHWEQAGSMLYLRCFARKWKIRVAHQPLLIKGNSDARDMKNALTSVRARKFGVLLYLCIV